MSNQTTYVNRVKNAILEYQNNKNTLVKESTGIQLIPAEVMLTEEDLTEDVIKTISEEFAPTEKGTLAGENCLHCALHKSCSECSYKTKLGLDCFEANSPYRRVKATLDRQAVNYIPELRSCELKLEEELRYYFENTGK